MSQQNPHMNRVALSFDAIFGAPPITDDEVSEHNRLVEREYARAEARRKAPMQEALPLP